MGSLEAFGALLDGLARNLWRFGKERRRQQALSWLCAGVEECKPEKARLALLLGLRAAPQGNKKHPWRWPSWGMVFEKSKGRKDLEELMELYVQGGYPLEGMSELRRFGEDRPALWWAVARGELWALEKALSLGAKPDAEEAREFGETPLAWALRAKNWAMAEALLDAGASPRMVKKDTSKALGEARKQVEEEGRCAFPEMRLFGFCALNGALSEMERLLDRDWGIWESFKKEEAQRSLADLRFSTRGQGTGLDWQEAAFAQTGKRMLEAWLEAQSLHEALEGHEGIEGKKAQRV